MNKEEIVRLLKEKDDYVSGQELCEYFGVSRTAVWKAIKQLEKDGYQIEAVNNKGYRLTESDDMMSAIEISANIDTKWVARNLVYHKETGSTNLDVKALAEEGKQSCCSILYKNCKSRQLYLSIKLTVTV